MDKYDELKREIEDIKNCLERFQRNFDDIINNLDENNFTAEFLNSLKK